MTHRLATMHNVIQTMTTERNIVANAQPFSKVYKRKL